MNSPGGTHHQENIVQNAKHPTPLSVQSRPIAELRPYPKNARTHSRHQIQQIARSIEAFGFNVPILIDDRGSVIAGHGRLLACELLGWKSVPTIELTHLSETQARAFRIGDNRLTEISEWDDRLLGEVLRELTLEDLDFNLDATGFEVAEIDLRIAALDAPIPKDDPADDLGPEAEHPPVSRPGDLWQLGEHRIFCGNSLERTSYTALPGLERAHAVFCDSPFNVPINGHCTGNGRIQHREFDMASGEMSVEEFTGFLRTACLLMAEHMHDGALAYLFIDWRHCGELLAASKEAFTELKNIAIWVKDSPGMGSFYRSQHEFVFVCKNGHAPHRNNVELGRYGRNRSNVWMYPGVGAFGRRTSEGRLLDLHPTVKPVALIGDAILDSTARGELVLDPFLGSGSTLIAADRHGRRCYGIELDALYVDTAIRRWQRLTGRSAVHATLQCTFDELSEYRFGGNDHE